MELEGKQLMTPARQTQTAADPKDYRAENQSDLTLAEAIELVLRDIAAMAGPEPAAYFRDKLLKASDYGVEVAAQHLRNLLMGYLALRDFERSPAVFEKIVDRGFKRGLRSVVARLIDLLEIALLRHFHAELPGLREPAEPVSGNILFIVDYLYPRDRLFAHTRQVCTYAAAARQVGGVGSVLVMSTQETGPEHPFHAPREVGDGDIAGWRVELEEIGSAHARDIGFWTPDRIGPVRPYRSTIEKILAYRPEITLTNLCIFRSRVTPFIVSGLAPIISIQMNEENPEPRYTDLVLAHGYSDDFDAKPTPRKWRNHKVPLVPYHKFSVFPISQLGPELDLRIVTVLTLGRLEAGLLKDDAKDLKFVIRFLEAYPRAVWIMVALNDPADFAEKIKDRVPANVSERLVLLGVVPDLRAIYEHCQVYVHLPALWGGNVGMAMAIEEGVPVLSRAGTDAANILDEKSAYGDENAAWRKLCRLAESPGRRKAKVRKQAEFLAAKHSVDAVAADLRYFMEEAQAEFKARAGRLPSPVIGDSLPVNLREVTGPGSWRLDVMNYAGGRPAKQG